MPRSKTVLLIAIGALLLSMPVHETKAVTYETLYTVYSNYCGQSPCIVGPQYCNVLVGEWIHECDGGWSGWGEQPYSSCTRTEVERLDPCS